MTRTTTIRTIAFGALAAGTMLFFSQSANVGHAHAMPASNNLKQIGIAVHQYDDSGTSGYDFYTWQRSPADAGGVSDLGLWQDTYGTAASAAAPASGDLGLWQSNYGSGPSASSEGTHEVGHWQGTSGVAR